MTLLFDKHWPIDSPALAPADDDFEQRDDNRPELTIGLINNMPDAGLKATERQFSRLLQAVAENVRIRLHCFTLRSVRRSSLARVHIDRDYRDIGDLGRLAIDGLIVTGAEPAARTLTREPYWRELTEVIDWARSNTRSTIWSCLAAHAAVLHLDGIERQCLETKCSGVFDCAKVTDHWLTENMRSPLKIAHSRLNGLAEGDLAAPGYQLLTQSREAGVDIFTKALRSQFIFFQGHPEYDELSLEREYLRDISRFLAGERDTYPAVPAGYFDAETEEGLTTFQKRASFERRPALSAELPNRTLRHDIAAGAAATAIFRNWLGYLSEGATAALQNAGRGKQ